MIVVNGCLLWHGCLSGLSLAGERDDWPPYLGHLADRAVERCLGAYPSDDSAFWTPPDFGDAVICTRKLKIVPLFGLMAAWKIIHLVGLRLLVLGCIFLPHAGGPSWVLRKNIVMLGPSAAVLLCQFLVHFRPFSALSSGVRYWRCWPVGLVILVLIIST